MYLNTFNRKTNPNDIFLLMHKGQKIYFLSDFHLGAPDQISSLEREKRIIRFLNQAEKDAAIIFIMGDLFDFWFEYKKVVPKGYVRILGKLASLTDQGIRVEFFVGNHDMWMKDYFQKELNIPVHFQPVTYTFEGKVFYMGHGDGLGPGDHGYKMIKKIFRNGFAQGLFGLIPPRVGIGLANYFSRKSRAQTGIKDEVFMGEENEWLVMYCKEILRTEKIDYFIFGHRHLPLDIKLNDKSRYINLGDWIKYNSYAIFDGEELALHYYKDEK
ncbi:MAG: UDP-2,3-diacylglucosamine diphosphatase [Sphingobacteriales bacterium]|nr:UDP-2,3-diacylglucosamine diphosphatase [Sphingobacteriales bacterium]